MEPKVDWYLVLKRNMGKELIMMTSEDTLERTNDANARRYVSGMCISCRRKPRYVIIIG